jgi:integrase
MRPEDVYEETYHDADGAECAAWVMRITNEAENQEVKTQASVRRFPIHAELIRRGFIEYAKAQRGNARLFDKLKKNQYGDESALFGAWFSEYLRKVCGVIDKRMVFHSFRHGFKDLCRAAGLPEEIHDALTGHSSSKVARRYGGLTYPLAPLVTAVAKLRVPGLQLPF